MQVPVYSRSIGEWSNERKFNYDLKITGGNNRLARLWASYPKVLLELCVDSGG